MSPKKERAGVHPAYEAGWQSACQLYEHLATGGELTALPPGPLRLEPGETGHAQGVLGYARFYGMKVSYNQSNSFWFGSATFVAAGMAATAMGNASARSRAERMAAAQWRNHGQVRTMLTSRRLMCDFQNSWVSFWHEGIVEFACDLSQWSFVLRYQVGNPLMLYGPAAPWFAVAIARIAYGVDGLRLDCLAPLASTALRGEIVESPRRALPPGGTD